MRTGGRIAAMGNPAAGLNSPPFTRSGTQYTTDRVLVTNADLTTEFSVTSGEHSRQRGGNGYDRGLPGRRVGGGRGMRKRVFFLGGGLERPAPKRIYQRVEFSKK